MDINNFLDQFVKGYLFNDLESMKRIVLPEDQKDGACGYPMIMSTLSGMELLGVLTSPNKYNHLKGDAYFKLYWDNFLVPYNDIYKDFSDFFRIMIRHGLMHSFATKTNVLITKGSAESHMHYDNKDLGIIAVDVNVFYDDFKNSYYRFFDPIVQENKEYKNIRKDSIQARLSEFIDFNNNDSKTNFSTLPDPIKSMFIPKSGASTSFPTSPSGIRTIDSVNASGTASFPQ